LPVKCAAVCSILNLLTCYPLCTENLKPKIDPKNNTFSYMHFFNRRNGKERCKIAYWQVSFGNIFQLWRLDLKLTLWIYCALQNIISPMYFDNRSRCRERWGEGDLAE
jgi:hypothetical protein